MAENGGVIALIVLLAAISVGGFIYCRQRKLSLYKQMGEDCKNDKAYQDVNRGQKVSIIAGIIGIAVVLAMNPFGPASEEEQEKMFIEWASGVMNEPYFNENNWKRIKDIFLDDAKSRKNSKKTIKKLENVLAELDELDKKISKLKVPSRLSKERREVLSKVVDHFKKQVQVEKGFCNYCIDVCKAMDKKDTEKLKELDDEIDLKKVLASLNASTVEMMGAFYEVGNDFGVVPKKNENGIWSWVKWDQIKASQEQEKTSAASLEPSAKQTTPPATPKPQNVPASSDSTVSKYPATPEQILQAFHQNITNKDYRKAYLFLSKNFRDSAPYDGWEAGFRTTVSSIVSDVKVESQSGSQAVLTYTLKAVDNPGGTQYFRGTAVFVWTKSGWRIDDMTNKPM